MRYIINIDNNISDEDDSINLSVSDEINIYIKDISEIYPNVKEEFRKKVNKQIKMYKGYFFDDSIEKKNLDVLENLVNKLVSKNTENQIIKLCSYTKEIIANLKKYYPDNCLIDITNIDDQEKISLLTEFNYPNNIKFIDRYTKYSHFSSRELLDMYEKIYNIKEIIDGYPFTPLEKVIYIYDEVRKKPYKNNEKNIGASRNLNEVLSNNDIVCEGYANIVEALCNSLGIECEKIYWYPKEGNCGHVSNMIYINDDYYDVHGFYSIDATATNSGNYSDYLEKYSTFLIPLDTVTKVYEKRYGYYRLNNNEDLIKNVYEKLTKLVDIDAPQTIIDGSIEYLVKKIRNTYKKIGDKDKVQKCDETLDSKSIDFETCSIIYNNYEKLFKTPPNDFSLTKAMYRVKRIEYLENPIENELNIDILKNSYATIPGIKGILRIANIFGVDIFQNYIDNISEIKELSNIEASSSEEKINKDIKRLKLLNILRNELGNKEEKNKTYEKK